MAKIIGIDLGTTNSCVAIMEGGKPKVIENSEGARTTPSIVAYTDNDEILVGAPAKRQAVTNAKNTLFRGERLIGEIREKRSRRTSPDALQDRAADNGDAGSRARQEDRAAAVSAEVLRNEEDRRGLPREPVTEAVITVPAYFNDSQRQATKDAGRIAA